MINCTSLVKMYRTEVENEIRKFHLLAIDTITESSIAHLPDPVKVHFRKCGFIGHPITHNVGLKWKNASIKMNRKSSWLKLKCKQFNSIPEPVRIVLMQSRIAGVIPFSGRDKFQDGHGNMYIRLMGILQIGDVKGPKMDQSALVTVLAEVFLAPSYALQPYIKWEAIDMYNAKATIECNNVKASGVFRFNESGEFVEFVTNDRWQNETDSATVKWSVTASKYIEKNGIRFPTDLRAIWHEKDGIFEYFKGEIEDMEFNIGLGRV